MIAVDTNLLVYAHRPECTFHTTAADRLKALAEGREAWGIPQHCLVEFAGVATNRRIWQEPSSAEQVVRQVEAWLESPSLRLLAEGPGWWPVFAACLREGRPQGGAVHDARIAACCKHNGVTLLLTADRDFGRYPWLRVRNPLVQR